MRYLAGAAGGRTALAPIGRVASPLAELDQRLHEGAEVSGELDADDGIEAVAPDAVEVVPSVPPHAVSAPSPAPPSTPKSAPPRDAFEALARSLEVVERWVGAPTAPSEPRRATTEPAKPLPQVRVLERVERVERIESVQESTPELEASPGERAETIEPSLGTRRVERRTAPDLRISVVPVAREERLVEREILVPLEAQPAHAVAEPTHAPSESPRATQTRAVERAAPSVTIGHLHVEIVRDEPTPRVAPKPTAPPKSTASGAARGPHAWPRPRPFGWRQR
jgi:hypothetical protein